MKLNIIKLIKKIEYNIPFAKDLYTYVQKNRVLSFFYNAIKFKKFTANHPKYILLETSTICNLQCLSCPTGIGQIELPKGTLSFENAKLLIDEIHPSIKNLVLSNFGEPFCCKDITRIIKYAHDKGMITSLDSNLNIFSEKLAKEVVESKLDVLNIALDGARQESYSKYRRNGSFDKVLEHVDMINKYKKEMKSDKPTLVWQFVPFTWNKDEMETARQMAKERDMLFKVKFNYDNTNALKEYSAFEYFKKHKKPIESTCLGVIHHPVINWDGELLGCCLVNTEKYSLGNVFKDGFFNVYNSAKMKETIRFIRHNINFIPLVYLQKKVIRNKKLEKRIKNVPDIVCKRCAKMTTYLPFK